jgi:F0F1-type ATP synthase assembly protein I
MNSPDHPKANTPKDADRNIVARGIVRADSMVEMALALPISTFVGWGLGELLGRPLHAAWPAIVGLILGAVAGFVQVLRLANKANRNMP